MRLRLDKIIKVVVLLVTVAVLAQFVAAMPPSAERPIRGRNGDYSLAPAPTSIDRITHNKGNIVTTIDNYGLVGGYPGYLPSGEWPRNSGHDYLAEIRYWIGTVTPAGDTLVADTYDDFQAIKMPVNNEDKYRIYLSTDSTRYYGWDPADTVGLGAGSPANGWRIWEPDQQEWTYDEKYNSLQASYSPSGPVSLQDSYYRFNDAALGSPLLGLEFTHHMMQWNYCYNEDFLYVILDITNTSTTHYTNVAFGLYADMDVGGLDGQGGNGNQNDQVVYDVADNWAYIYDVLGVDPGWGPTVKTGVMGTKLLETPLGIGMTALRTDDWAYLPDNDPGRFAMINSNQYDTPLPPTDQFYIQCVRGIDLPAGATVRLVYALVAGADSADFVANCNMAQQLYDNHYIGPQPPPTPTLRARAADRRVYLSWNDTSEVGIDPLSLANDFAGYKLYRSDNRGKTWGEVNWKTDNNCMEFDYYPVARYFVSAPGDPIPHSFVDTGLYNGVDYWYCLSAFDVGDPSSGVDALQSGFGIAGESPNVISARPHDNPAGYYDAAATVEHVYNGTDSASQGEVIPVVFDQQALQGSDYEVTFEDTPGKTYWFLINNTTGDTLLANQTRYDGDEEYYDIAEGLRVIVQNPELEPRGYAQTSFGGNDTTLSVSDFTGPLLPYWTGVESHAFGFGKYRAVYQLRYTSDSTIAPSMWEYFDGTTYPTTPIPFEVWNMTTNQRVSLALDKWPIDGTWNPDDALIIVDYPYDPMNDLTSLAFPYEYGWRFTLDGSMYNPSAGDVLTIQGAPVNGPDDVFSFKVDGVNTAAAQDQLKNIRVVPNPYFVQYSSMVETAEGQSVLEFQKVPDKCTIRIYTLAGDLVRTIVHDDGTGTARWNLQSSSQQQVASGIYIYHVESEYGERLGRFAIVK